MHLQNITARVFVLPVRVHVQWYTGGTEGRQTEVTFVCGDTHPRVKGILGPEGGKYHVWLEAPMFCDYRENAAYPVSPTLPGLRGQPVDSSIRVCVFKAAPCHRWLLRAGAKRIPS